MKLKSTYLLILLLPFLFNSCKDDEADTKNKYEMCCQENIRSEYSWLVNACTPNGDGLNDVFQIIERQRDSSEADKEIASVILFTAHNSDNKLIASIDTLVSKATGTNNTWNFSSGGTMELGAIELQYTIITVGGEKETLKYHICAFDCNTEKPGIDFSKCRFADQLDLRSGFVAPTNEPLCN